MNRSFILSLVIYVALLFQTSFSQANDGSFPIPQNVRIDASKLVWDPVQNAGGYNIYYSAQTENARFNLDYLTTVKGRSHFDISSRGTYSVVAFNVGASEFSSPTSPGASVVYTEGAAQDEIGGNSNYDANGITSPLVHIFAVTCSDVAAGESCTASCSREENDQSFFATGGACATSEVVEADAIAAPKSYSCTMPVFSGEVRAQVYCLNYSFLLERLGQ